MLCGICNLYGAYFQKSLQWYEFNMAHSLMYLTGFEHNNTKTFYVTDALDIVWQGLNSLAGCTAIRNSPFIWASHQAGSKFYISLN